MGRLLSKNELAKIKAGMIEKDEYDEEKFLRVVINGTPSLWCEANLNHPDKPEEPLELQWYQKQMIDEPCRMKGMRWGRGAGKSVSIVGLSFWDCMTEDGVQIFYYVPGKSQLERIYTAMECMIQNSPTVSKSIILDPAYKAALGKKDQIEHIINFKNGSRILFFICSQKPEKIRSHHGGKVIIDEAHYIGEDFINAINGVIVNMSDPFILQSSTPRGKFGNFFEWIRNPEVFSSHIKSSQSKYWSSDKAIMARALCPDEATYNREFNAEWDSELDSVYTEQDIDSAVLKAARGFGSIFRKEYGEFQHFMNYEQQWEEVMSRRKAMFVGVDWNSPNIGVQIVYLVETDTGELWVARIEVIKVQEFTQMKSVERILDVWHTHQPEILAVDVGYGAVQVEMIYDYINRKKDDELKSAFLPVDFSSTVDLAEDTTIPEAVAKKRKEAKKTVVRAKTHMVSLISTELKHGSMGLPAWEDGDGGLLTEMRSFRLSHISIKGEPIYSKEGGQHKHMALALAIYGRWKFYRDGKRPKPSTIGIVVGGTVTDINSRKIFENRGERTQDVNTGQFVLDSMTFRNPFSSRSRRYSRRGLLE